MSTSAPATTPTLLKIKNAGESLTIAVMSASLLKMGTYPEVEFVGIDGKKQFVAIRVPQKSADRQLERCELTYQTAAGRLLTISRDPSNDPKKPYWGITDNGDAPEDAIALMPKDAPAPSSHPVAAASSSANGPAANGNGGNTNGSTGAVDREKRSALYKRITQFVLSDIVPLYEAKKIPVTAETCAAMAATLYIAETKNGH